MGNRYLFRAKRKKYDSNEEVWVIGSYVHTNDGDYIVVPYKKSTLLGEGKYIEVVPETLCQCTGLKDKNGKLIWENDIIKDNVIYGVVRWDEVNARYIVDDREDGYQDYFEWWHECEVIGNIFDNKELLESEG